MTQLSAYNKEQLQDIVKKYPYFSAAQLQLAKKLEEENTPEDFQAQINKTLLYFNDAFWLNCLLHDAPATAEINRQEQADERLTQMLSVQAEEFNKELTGEDKLFEDPEPLYKTDYFKHQGIENVAVVQEETVLGAKVKKFTDWLKEMKKLNTTAPQFNTTEKEERDVEKMAMNSLENKNVITESMAEVLVQQGKKQQAIDIYEKLSLSNPEKSVYFASKIQFLKENNL